MGPQQSSKLATAAAFGSHSGGRGRRRRRLRPFLAFGVAPVDFLRHNFGHFLLLRFFRVAVRDERLQDGAEGPGGICRTVQKDLGISSYRGLEISSYRSGLEISSYRAAVDKDNSCWT